MIRQYKTGNPIPAVGTPLGSVILAVNVLFPNTQVPANGVYVMVGGVRSCIVPTNSSAPISGKVPLPAPSISSPTVVAIPPDSSWVGPATMCRSVAETNGAAAVLPKEAASLPELPAAEDQFLKLVAGRVDSGLKLATVNKFAARYVLPPANATPDTPATLPV